MNDQQHQNEAACGGSALTAGLGDLSDQFECHALSRSIDDIEAAGRAMRSAKAEIERMQAVVEAARCIRHWHDSDNDGMVVSGEHVRALWQALHDLDEVPNAEVTSRPPSGND